MNTLTKTLITIGVSTIASVAGASAQSTGIASTTATLIIPISISDGTPLNFGSVASSGAPGTITLTPAGVESLTGGLTKVAGSAVSAAAFTVTGEDASSFSIAIPTEFTISNGTNTLIVNGITADSPASTTLVAGTKAINVGATLNVPANTVAGTYVNDGEGNTGLFVTVNYN
jgi:hypothetical protein